MSSILPAQPERGLASTAVLKQLSTICWALLLVGFVVPFTVVVLISHRPPTAILRASTHWGAF